MQQTPDVLDSQESLDSEETAEQLLEFNNKPNKKVPVIAFVTAIYYVTTTADNIICSMLFIMYIYKTGKKSQIGLIFEFLAFSPQL